MTIPNVVLPSPHEEERLRASGYDVIQEYRRRYEEEHAGEPWVEDTKGWYHDPEWQTRTMSIQCARNTIELRAINPLWAVVGVLWLIAQYWFQIFSFFVR